MAVFCFEKRSLKKDGHQLVGRLQSDEINHFELLSGFGSIGHLDQIYTVCSAKFML